MGRTYTYECNKCGYEKEFDIGGATFLPGDYYEVTEELETQLKEEILSGKYGNLMKTMVDADNKGELRFSCDTDIFQCRRCMALVVHRKKNIRLWRDSDKQYKLEVNINQNCPECGSQWFEILDTRYNPRCPKCKDAFLELVSFGNYD